MKLSAFGEKFGSSTGIQVLMDDIGDALNSGQDMLMMGGGIRPLFRLWKLFLRPVLSV